MNITTPISILLIISAVTSIVLTFRRSRIVFSQHDHHHGHMPAHNDRNDRFQWGK